ncbi:MAG TPA: endonuclease/exonuclease/phosphatase family protein [Vicinamibacterales bacterium]|nr:endonuclease/exonuclease/phosphatase family protein [Vicinamibacterales bacterium]
MGHLARVAAGRTSLPLRLLGACTLAGACGLRQVPLAPPAAALQCRAAVSPDGAPAHIEWRVPVDPSERARLAAWCAAAGPPVVDVLPRDARAPADEHAAITATEEDEGNHAIAARAGRTVVDHLAVVSWNVHVDGGDLLRFVRDLRAGRFTRGRPVRHFVLLLQEAWRAGPRVPLRPPEGARFPRGIDAGPSGRGPLDIVAAARVLGLSLYYAPSMRNGEGGDGDRSAADRGNAILSTLPLADPIAVELPFEHQRRVAVMATLRAAGAEGVPLELPVVSVHLDALARRQRLWIPTAIAARGRQARALGEVLPRNGPLVLGGDLNTWFGPGEPAVQVLMRHFPRTPRPPRQPTAALGRLLDYLFFRPPAGWRAEYWRVTSKYGSDHHPLVGWLEPFGPRVSGAI